MSSVENKWWLIALVAAGSAVFAQWWFVTAGFSLNSSVWTIVIYALCVSAMYRLLSGLSGFLCVRRVGEAGLEIVHRAAPCHNAPVTLTLGC